MRHIALFTASVLLLSVLVVVCPAATRQVRGYFRDAGNDATDVSLVQLIAEPQKYDGKRVRFIGFLRIEFEGDAIYLHREDFDYGIARNGLWVEIPSDMTKQQQQAVNMHYAICVGTFQASRQGHIGMFSGEIAGIQRLELWAEQPRSTVEMPSPPR